MPLVSSTGTAVLRGRADRHLHEGRRLLVLQREIDPDRCVGSPTIEAGTVTTRSTCGLAGVRLVGRLQRRRAADHRDGRARAGGGRDVVDEARQRRADAASHGPEPAGHDVQDAGPEADDARATARAGRTSGMPRPRGRAWVARRPGAGAGADLDGGGRPLDGGAGGRGWAGRAGSSSGGLSHGWPVAGPVRALRCGALYSGAVSARADDRAAPQRGTECRHAIHGAGEAAGAAHRAGRVRGRTRSPGSTPSRCRPGAGRATRCRRRRAPGSGCPTCGATSARTST